MPEPGGGPACIVYPLFSFMEKDSSISTL